MAGEQLQPPGIPGQDVPAATPAYVQAVAPKTSGMAITSLVLGIIGLVICLPTFGVVSLIGLILAILSLRAIGKSLGQLVGRGMAIAGIVLSSIGLVLNTLWILMFVFAAGFGGFSAFRQARMAANEAVDSANMHGFCVATQVYANNHDSCLPDPENWKEQLEPYLSGHPDDVPESPYEDVMGCGFAMNSLLIDTVEGQRVPLKIDKIADPSKTVLFFEAGNNSPPAGGPDLLPDEPRGPQGYLIGFVDGHVEHVEWDDLEDLNWSADGSDVYEFEDKSELWSD